MIVILAVVVVGGVASAGIGFRLGHEPYNGPTWPVIKQRLTQTVIEKGALESEDNGDIACEVKAKGANTSTSTTIKWVQDDGTIVKQATATATLKSDGSVGEIIVDDGGIGYMLPRGETVTPRVHIIDADLAKRLFKNSDLSRRLGKKGVDVSQLDPWEQRERRDEILVALHKSEGEVSPSRAPRKGGGKGAKATASVDRNGKVTKIKVESGGQGYTAPPEVIVEGPEIMLLDDSNLIDQRDQQEITVLKAWTDKITAEQKYNSDNYNSQKDIELARLNFRKYVGEFWHDIPENVASSVGFFASPRIDVPLTALPALDSLNKADCEYQQALEDVLGKIDMAIGDRDAWQERSSWSRRMYRLGYVSKTQADSDQSKLDSAEFALKSLLTQRGILEITRKYEETNRRSTWLALQVNARSQELTNSATRESTAKVWDKETAKMADLRAQIVKCVIRAPRDGMLVYYFSAQAQGGFGSRQPAIANGEPVNEGQKLLRIPNPKKMLVRAKIHEAMVPNVEAGQKATILIDSVPGVTFKGKVKRVAAVPSQVDMFSSDVKLFEAEIVIEDSLEGYKVKPQMTARVTITSNGVQEEVLTVPIQSVFGNMESDKRRCFVVGADGQPRVVEIEVGLNNDRLIEVKKGLEEGDKVVLNPAPLLVGDLAKFKAGTPRGGRLEKGPESKGDANIAKKAKGK